MVVIEVVTVSVEGASYFTLPINKIALETWEGRLHIRKHCVLMNKTKLMHNSYFENQSIQTSKAHS